jgi:KaiC/GvpD/RAD55 family RecA-like ATPase
MQDGTLKGCLTLLEKTNRRVRVVEKAGGIFREHRVAIGGPHTGETIFVYHL